MIYMYIASKKSSKEKPLQKFHHDLIACIISTPA